MFFRKHNCARDGHRLEARYDTSPVTDEGVLQAALDGASLFDVPNVIANLQTRIYVCDICPCCGFTVKR
jgi:hypothetical protein